MHLMYITSMRRGISKKISDDVFVIIDKNIIANFLGGFVKNYNRRALFSPVYPI